MVGDLVLLQYVKKYGKDLYRLARVLRVKPDEHGRARTVVVGVRDLRKAAREKPEKCSAGLREMEVGVQRVVVILPMEEQTIC